MHKTLGKKEGTTENLQIFGESFNVYDPYRLLYLLTLLSL